MATQTCIDETRFKEMEKHILNQVMDVSKSMIESFKFRMIYGMKISEEQNQRTIKSLQEFRAKNWDKSMSKKEAYKKYISLY